MILDPDTVHVFRLTISADDPSSENDLVVLSVDERERAARYRFETDRSSFVRTRGALRGILGEFLGVRPAILLFDKETSGKPMLARTENVPDIRFNVSHCAGLSLIAVALGREVGIDAESLSRPIEDRDAIAARFFSDSENSELAAYPEHERGAAFLRCWTRKEAVVKGLGTGFQLPLAEFSVSLDQDEPRLLEIAPRHEPGVPWALRNLAVPPGFTAALAVQGPDARLIEHGEYSPGL